MATEKLTVEMVSDELATLVEDANQFMVGEFSEDWETAERYFKGRCDLLIVEGRSSMVKTTARDVIRAVMPSVMRVLLQARKPVEYWPNNIRQAAFVDQQSMWINQTFYRNGGYMQLYSAILEGLKMKAGPVKCYWEENATPEYIKITGIPASEVMQYLEQPDLVVDEVVDHTFQENSPFEGSELYDLCATRYYQNGCLRIEAFPIYEFFVSRNANNLEDAAVHGHRRSIKVSEALALGLEYDDWDEFDDEDPEVTDAAASSKLRRGYSKDTDNDQEVDPLNKTFLLSEVYCQYDLDNDGVSEKYCFYLGGTSYKYIHHERVNDYCIDLVVPDPMPFTVIGRSVIDITKMSQDTQTSLLRAMIDNAHIANNPRPAGDPARVDFNDLMNNAIGAPIKTRGRAEIQLFDVPFTAGNLLPVLDFLDKDAENRIGVTRAAQGLDPDAMQSTDKNAVMNTIQLSQGQVELMARNIIETGLIPLFKKMLKLSIQHMDNVQMLRYKGAVIPIDITNFSPDLLAEPAVGLGTTSPMQRLQTLNFIYAEQQKYMMQFGLDNPFTSLSQMYNAIEDMVELGGIPNVGRYFNYVGKDEEQIIAQKLAEEAAKAAEEAASNAPADPSKVMMAIESSKRRVETIKMMNESRDKDRALQQEALIKAEELDLKRDEMAAKRVVDLATLRRDDLNQRVKAEQDASKPKRPTSTGSGKTSAKE